MTLRFEVPDVPTPQACCKGRGEALPVDASAQAAAGTPPIASRTPNEVWDLANLIKPTLDAMESVFGGCAHGAAGHRVIVILNGQSSAHFEIGEVGGYPWT
jgi:hypothetical protein